jgi:HemK-like putative methylase
MELALFDGLALLAAPGLVMTPRSTSEALVAPVAAHLDGRVARVADVGTGSGALAVALAARLPDVEVWAIDTSRAACLLARANVRLHGLDDRVVVRHGDLLAPVPGCLDAVVANLPYVPEAEASAHPELAREPADAVFSPGDGLEPYRRLVAAASDRLAPDGLLALQLDRRVVVARAHELAELAAALRPRARTRAARGRAVARPDRAQAAAGPRARAVRPAKR